MNVVKVSEADAFNSGSELWIIKNKFENKWWQEIDFRSGFLLSHYLHRSKKFVAPQMTEILKLTGISRLEFVENENTLLIGSSHHFLNKWILIWNADASEVSDKIQQLTENLKIKSIRLFSDSEVLLSHLKTRPKTSLADFSFIENT